MAGRLEGKVCVITGAAGGIGAATAELFAAEGAIVVGADLDEAAGVDLALRVDVADDEQVAGMYRQASERFGRIDVLFNNAGISPSADGSVLETPDDVWERVIDVNLRSVFSCCKHGIPHLQAAGGGSVINTASFVAVMGAPRRRSRTRRPRARCWPCRVNSGWSSRAAACASTRSARPVNTPAAPVALRRRSPSRRAGASSTCPMGRFAEAREIAQGALFLASDESSYVNASTFLVDGGLSGRTSRRSSGRPAASRPTPFGPAR
jgi:NAD(P)-dependent dehydrogenase (short-subunit alcohol dehydrogenase family)